jgi:hypothetical protein
MIHEDPADPPPPPPHPDPPPPDPPDTTGAVTVIVRVTGVAILPAASVFVYVSTYAPVMAVFTVPDATRVPDPSKLSIQVAPASIYDAHCVRVIAADPERVIIGAVVSGAATTVTVRVRTIAIFPAVSVAL